jgi:hypothetical protein
VAGYGFIDIVRGHLEGKKEWEMVRFRGSLTAGEVDKRHLYLLRLDKLYRRIRLAVSE